MALMDSQFVAFWSLQIVSSFPLKCQLFHSTKLIPPQDGMPRFCLLFGSVAADPVRGLPGLRAPDRMLHQTNTQRLQSGRTSTEC